MDVLHPWYWRSQPLCDRSGSTLFTALFSEQTIATLLESPHPHPLGRYSICAGGPRQIAGKQRLWTPQVGHILPFLEQLLQCGPSLRENAAPEDLPFQGGWLGWLGYDLAWEIERLPRLQPDPLPFPVAYWYEPENFAVLDHQQQRLWLAATDPQQLDRLEQRLHQVLPTPTHSPYCDPTDFQFLTNNVEYERMVQQALQHIQAGDIFQANLSTRFCVTASVDAWQLYTNLQTINPSPFASYWRTPWGSVVSCSPERLVKLYGHQAETRPIAGTRPRGTTPEQDHALAQALLNNVKERAEHTMLVDLERNDLGRVCTWGSVAVDEFLVLEYYSHVTHLVSNIVGLLKPSCSPIDLIRSMFPGGTITGCPKVRCMEIIATLEPYRRSLFYGSCGYLDHRGRLDLNILIRTLLVTPTEQSLHPRSGLLQPAIIWGQVGAGIVADSNPEQEWLESLQKAKAQVRAIQKMGD
ncbi:anthranilate synthase component I [Acaryochloris sp. IP29b_bin.148]|uniref:anthranilate synthase component I n=1 Tax=Acaryochloris sp. IP29b_bin.148 TaxID=2969218 RepID=UPI00261C538C|nr:anthranilate synthase component I [Acaryochloris sp. IP29b_bin.148]